MFKVTPNPPRSNGAEAIDPRAADRALAHYNLPQGRASKRACVGSASLSKAQSPNREEILVNVSSILDSAVATAYEHADNLTGPSRKVAMGLVHLVDLARRELDSLLDEGVEERAG